MKNLIFTLIAIATLSGCGNNAAKKNTVTDDALSAYETASLSPERVYDVFLGFSFKMTKGEVLYRLDSLYKSGKLSINSRSAYTYSFNTEQGSLLATFTTEYFNDTLCVFQMIFEPGSGALGTPGLVMHSVIDVFKKQSQGYEFHIDETNADSPVYYYIRDNIVVKFASSPEASMSYINAPKYTQLLENIKKAKSDKVNSTLSDF